VSQHKRYQKQQQKHSDATAAKHSNEPAQQQQGGEHHHEKTKRGKIGSFLCVVFARVETTRWICQEYQQQHQNRQWQSSENTQKLVASTTKEDGNSVQHKMILPFTTFCWELKTPQQRGLQRCSQPTPSKRADDEHHWHHLVFAGYLYPTKPTQEGLQWKGIASQTTLPVNFVHHIYQSLLCTYSNIFPILLVLCSRHL